MAYRLFDLTGKVVLVTGGNRGIGFGMAQAVAAAGADVAIWGRDKNRNDKAVSLLCKQGARALAREVDVAVESEVVEGMTSVVEKLGRIDAVFVNAGIGALDLPPFTEVTTDGYRKIMAVNLDGAFWTLREAARHMVERANGGDPGGSLVGIASLAAIEGAARNQAYAATKGALVSMIRGCAVEFARHSVRSNVILPGWIDTEMTSHAQETKAFADKVIPRVPARRWGEPADFGGIAVYLASDASSYHSGNTMIVDGGYSVF